MERNLERMLVAIDESGNGFVVAAKGYVMETDIQDNGLRLIDDMGIPLPEDGLPAILAVFESHPYFPPSRYDPYNGDYDGGDPVYDSEGCRPRWRTLSDTEWAMVVRGDLEGLLKSWVDVRDRHDLEQEWLDGEVESDPDPE